MFVNSRSTSQSKVTAPPKSAPKPPPSARTSRESLRQAFAAMSDDKASGLTVLPDPQGDPKFKSWKGKDLVGESAQKKRQAVLAAARKGDPQAMRLLAESGAGEDYSSRNWAIKGMREAQVEGLKVNKEYLSSQNYQSLFNELDYNSTAQAILAEASKGGSEAALSALRKHLQEPERRPGVSGAAEALAHSGERLQDADYSYLLRSTESSKGSAAAQVLTSAARKGNEAAQGAMRTGLSSQDSQVRRRAAEAVGKVPGLIGPEEVKRLSALVSEERSGEAALSLGRAAGRGQSEALQAMNEIQGHTKEKAQLGFQLGQADGKAQAVQRGEATARTFFREKLNSEDSAVSYEMADYLKEEFQQGNLWALDALNQSRDGSHRIQHTEMLKQLGSDFANTADPAKKGRMAPYLFESTTDPKLSAQTFELTVAGARGGDQRALEGLARYTSRTSRSIHEDKNLLKQASAELSSLAEGGQAAAVAKTLLAVRAEKRELTAQGRVHDYDSGNNVATLDPLARAAAKLDPADPTVGQVRQVLREELEEVRRSNDHMRGGQSVVAAMGKLQGRLGLEDLQSLASVVNQTYGAAGVDAATLLSSEANNLPPKQREALLGKTLDGLRAKDKNDRNSVERMRALSPHLRPGDLAALGTEAGGKPSKAAQAASSLIGDVLASDTSNPQQKAAAMRALLQAGTGNLSKETRAQMVAYAVDSKDPKLKKAMLDTIVPNAPDFGQELGEIGQAYQSELSKRSLAAFEKGDKSSPLFKLGQLLHVQLLGAKGGEFQGEIDNAKLSEMIGDLAANDEPLRTEMASVSRDVVERWSKTRKGRAVVRKQIDYMRSEAFQERLRLLDPKDRDQALSQQVARLAYLAPDRAEEVTNKVAQTSFDHATLHPLEGVAHLDAKTKKKTVAGAFKEVIAHSKNGTKLLKDIVSELDKLPPTADQSTILERLKRRGLTNEDGRLNKALGALGIIGLGADIADGKLPTDIDTALSQAAQLSGISSNLIRPGAQAVAGLSAAGNLQKSTFALRSSPKTLKMLQLAKAISRKAPIVGDALGALMDSKSAFESFQRGDDAKGAVQATAAGFGVLALGLGIKAGAAGLANGWNPLGWAALGVGAVATTAGVVATQMDGRNELLVKELGLFDPAAAAYYAMDGGTTNDGQLMRALTGKSATEMEEIKSVYHERYKETLRSAVTGDTSGDYEDALLGMLNGYRGGHDPHRDARDLERAIRGPGTTESVLNRILTQRSTEDLKAIAESFRRRTGGTLVDWVKGDTDGHYRRALLTALGTAELH